MKVLVTGGAGFIGSHLVDRLVAEGYSVRVVDNLSSGRLKNLKKHLESNTIELIIGDLKDPQTALRAVEGVDVVFHFAANPEVRVSTTNPEIHFNENVLATFRLLEAMREKSVKELVFASSSSVYGEPEKIPVHEEAPIRPVSVYGASKAACENLIHAYSKLYGIKAIVLRYANVVGPRLRHGVIYDLLMKLKRDKEKLEVLGNGTQIRSYIYIDDAVEATIVAWRRGSKKFNIFNIASEDWIAVNDVVATLLEVLNLKKIRIIFKPVLHGVGWPGDVKRVVLDISKVKGLGWKPKMSSQEAITKAIKDILNESLY